MLMRLVAAARARARIDRLWRRARTGRVVPAVLAAVVVSSVAVLAAGCGGGSHPGASAGTSTAAAAPAANSGNPSSSSASSGDQLVKFSQCMRVHGLADFPDPVNGQLNLRVTKGSDLDPNSAKFQSAMQSCQSLLPAGQGPGSAPSGQQQTKFLKFARCMRSHGVSNFPDPQGGGGFLISGNIQSNPHFQTAMQACRSILGNGPLVGAGG